VSTPTITESQRTPLQLSSSANYPIYSFTDNPYF